MATLQDVIDDARYGLTDYTDGVGVGIEFDDEELLNYMNRMISLMDSQLSALNSDLVEAKESDINTVASQAYVDISNLNSGNWTRIRSVWIGTNLLIQVPLSYMRYTSMYRSGNAQPTIWALSGQTILFPQGCDSIHTDFVIYYDKKTGTLTLSDDMPYNGVFDGFLREMLVETAMAKKNDALSRAADTMQRIFKERAMHEVIAREFVPRKYNYTEF